LIPSNDQLDDLRTLILKSRSESLSEAEIDQLNNLVSTKEGGEESAKLIDQLCAFTDSGTMESLPIEEILCEAFSKEAIEKLPEREAPPQNTATPCDGKSSIDAYWLVGLAASHLFVATLVWWAAKSTQEASITPIAGETIFLQSPPQLVSMTACVWRDLDEAKLVLGEPLQSGEELNLVEGIAELRTSEGTSNEALVRIEGPSSVLVRNDSLIELREGILTAESLGIGSRSFTLDTPFGEVSLDDQSSIGVISRSGMNEVHLFWGRATVECKNVNVKNLQLRLDEGEAVRFLTERGKPLELVRFEASQDDFVSTRSSGFDPLNLNQQYVNTILQSKPNIYWRFEEVRGTDPLVVVNEGSDPNMDAVLIGDLDWRQYGGNRVADLGQSETASAFQASAPWPSTPLDEYTIEMWIKPRLFHEGDFFCLVDPNQLENRRRAHGMLLETLAQHWNFEQEELRPNRIRFVHRTPPSNRPFTGSNLISKSAYSARTWQHIAAQKQGDQLRLWLDGELVATASDPTPLHPNMQILIGQIYPTEIFRRFVGQIDEVAIYERCLPPEELHEHIIAAGRSINPE